MTYISASQISTFRDCPRKWGYDKLDKVPREPNPSAALGSRVHAIAEDWLRDGTPPDPDETFEYERKGKRFVRHPGRIFVSGIEFNPEPGEATIEGKFTYREEDFTFLGYIDAEYWGVVHDHKTSSNPRRYGLEPSDMFEDPQCVLYAEKAFRDGHQEVTLRWVYYPTTPPYTGAYKVEQTVTREDMAAGWAACLETAEAIREARTKKRALELAPSPDACYKYGGCPYLGRCEREDPETMMDDELQSLLSVVHGDDDAPPPIPSDDAPPPIPSDDAPPPIPSEGRRPKASGKDLESIAALAGTMDPSAISIELDLAVSEVKRVLSTMKDPINPPEAPEPGGEGPIEEGDKPEPPSGDRAEWGRAEWKQHALAMGYVDSSCRLGEKKLRELVEEKERTQTDVRRPPVDDVPQVTCFDPADLEKHAGRGIGDLTDIEIALIKAFREVTNG